MSASKRLAKLEAHDLWAPDALEWLINWLRDEPELILACARGRHAEGSVLYDDSLMYEYDPPRLAAEALQELGDAVNYIAVKLAKESQQ